MPLAFQPTPWSGTPSAVWASQGAAVPVMSGSGFNWASIIGSMYGGRVSAYTPTIRGVPLTASYVRSFGGMSGLRGFRGLRGLGQDYSDIFSSAPPSIDNTPVDPTGLLGAMEDWNVSNVTPTGTSGGTVTNPIATQLATNPNLAVSPTSSLTQILAPLTQAGASIGQMFASYQNPLLQAQSTALQAQAGSQLLNAQTLSSLLPILLIGGVIVLVVMMAAGAKK
jgi:hypothetical protein